MTEDFKKIIDEDISKCEEEITRGNKESRGTLHGVLISKYTKIIDAQLKHHNMPYYFTPPMSYLLLPHML